MPRAATGDMAGSLSYSCEIPAGRAGESSARKTLGGGVAFHFENQVLDPPRRELSRGGRLVAVEPRVFDLLLYMIENRHRLVTKDELIARVWGGRIISDSALTSTVNAARKAIGDSGREQRLLRTSARKGFRFVGTVSTAERSARDDDRGLPVTRYARSGEMNIAWQALGTGPLDLVVVPGIISHIEYLHELPGYSETLRRMSSFARVITFDPRGRGLSDRLVDAPSYEQRLDDIRAVMDAARSSRAVLFGFSSGAATSAQFAAAYPERVSHLVLWGGLARGPSRSPELMEQYCTNLLSNWGSGTFVKSAVSAQQPVSADTMGRFGKLERLATGPGDLKALLHISNEMDVTPVLPDLAMPTLVLCRETDAFVRVERSRALASLIRGSTLIEYPEGDHAFWSGDTSGFLGDLEQFVTGRRGSAAVDTGLGVVVTVLATNIADEKPGQIAEPRPQTQIVAHDRLGREMVQRHGGTVVTAARGNLLATFNGAGRAVRCALQFGAAAMKLGLVLRAGLHSGDIETRGPDIVGPAVQGALRVMSQSNPGQVLVSRVVVDLVSAADLQFAGTGTDQTKTLPGVQGLYSASLRRIAAV
jgi:DNA-binding winged helix-turn-helix (wHTH) protein/pimeloyl-ACP methyl ester carboxylesterase/class 3 adenylate cyclase